MSALCLTQPALGARACMAEDELLIPIDQALWPKGVVRGLTPVLRELGDKHGHLVIVPQPTKGVIMVKGPLDKVEEAKPGLKAIIEEHFPDLEEMPEELSAGRGAQIELEAAAAEEACCADEEKEVAAPVAPPSQTPSRPGVAATPAPALKVPAAAASVPGAPSVPLIGRKRPAPPGGSAPAELLWECMRKSSSFCRRPSKELKRPFSAEPINLTGLHAYRFSGLASLTALDVRPATAGMKESIVLLQSHSKASRLQRPGQRTIKTGLHKCPKRGLAQLTRELDGKYYCRGLSTLARMKYVKVQQSFRKRKPSVRSRRARK